MKAKIYVNWEEEEILTEADYNEKISESAKDKLEEELFEEFCENQYTFRQVFGFTEEDKAKAKKDFEAHCHNLAEWEAEQTYFEYEMDF